ncbi:MAG TPA: hypothetical protein VKS01_05335 [Bryobacteraceae bacterium]|nr:hypothetical protein [Bryobacteraceae bacterium]
MHTRRIAAFFLGAWIAGGLFVMLMSLNATGATSRILTSPLPPAAKMIDTLGSDNAAMLLHHAAEESIRLTRHSWENIELVLGLLLVVCLLLATQRRILPLVFCGAMLILLAFQRFGITSELAFRGEQTDFPPGNSQLGARERYLALDEVYYVTEVIKLATGGLLASYLFVFRARRSRKEIDAMDDSRIRHANR